MTAEPPLLQRLKERKLVQWALAYLAGAFVVFQLLDALAEPLGLSTTVQQAVLAVVVVGFFIALILAWYHGEKGRQRVSGPELLMVAALLVVAGGVLSVIGPEAEIPPLAETTAIPEGDFGSFIAVLPLANLSGREEDAWFTEGMHGQILTQLYKIGSLGVISGTSVQEYRETPKNLRTIGRELGARYIAEGDVLRAGDEVRVNLQLIDAETDTHLWADSYDRPLSVENLLSIQTEIAQAIAGALRGALTPGEEQELGRHPTDNLEAYDFYLRGRAYHEGLAGAGYTEQSRLNVLQMYERAIELDPGFALAHAWLAAAHLGMVYSSYGDREEQLQLARKAVDRALELAPDLAEAHIALSAYYQWLPDHHLALREIAVAERALPGDATVLSSKAGVFWLLERWDEAVALQYRVVALDPRGTGEIGKLGRWLALLRRYEEAERYMSRSLELWPENAAARVVAAYYLPWYRDGNPEPWLREIMDPDLPHAPWVGSLRWEANFLSRDFEAALDVLRTMDVEFERWNLYFPAPLLEGITYRFAGEPELARAAFDSARVVLERRVQEQPGDPRVHRALGLAYAGLGMKEMAIEEGLRVVDLFPKFQLSEPSAGFDVWGLVFVYVLLGDHDQAIEQLGTLLASPVGPTVNQVRANPWFDDFRDHPRFRDLLERYEGESQHPTS